MLSFLKGKKTYIVAVLVGVATAAQAAGMITPEQLQIIIGLLTAGGLAALRAGVSNVAR